MSATHPLQTFHWGGTTRRVATDAKDFDYASVTVPHGALFVQADEPLLIYPSVAAAERHLEAIDVEEGIYPAAYGPKGEPYRVGTEGNRVIIERTGEGNKPDELRALVLHYLEAIGGKSDPKASLDELVAEAWASESDFWQMHDPYSERFAARIPLWGCVAVVLLVAVAIYVALR